MPTPFPVFVHEICAKQNAKYDCRYHSFLHPKSCMKPHFGQYQNSQRTVNGGAPKSHLSVTSCCHSTLLWHPGHSSQSKVLFIPSPFHTRSTCRNIRTHRMCRAGHKRKFHTLGSTQDRLRTNAQSTRDSGRSPSASSPLVLRACRTRRRFVLHGCGTFRPLLALRFE